MACRTKAWASGSKRRGKSFPRLDRLIRLLNVLETTPNFILCDVLHELPKDYVSELEGRLKGLPLDKQHKVLEVMDFLIKQELKEEKKKQKQEEIDNPPKT